jgi:glycosyltransferase involved in cell wall biosynthesis
MRGALPPLAINGKFLAAQPTGVHRVAAELTHALAALAEGQVEFDIEIWVPRDAADAAAAFNLPVRVIGPFTHIPWEQIGIPFRDSRRLLLNLCNIGPVLRRHAITMIHDAQVHTTPSSYSKPFRLWYKGLQPIFGRNHQKIVTVSDFSRAEIVRHKVAAPDHIAVVHNGVDHVLRIEPEAGVLEKIGLQPRGYVVALASTQAHKNIALLAQAFALQALAGLRLVLVGGTRREEFAASGISLPANALLAGRVSDSELRALYEGALCVAFPSRTEGFGLPPLGSDALWVAPPWWHPVARCQRCVAMRHSMPTPMMLVNGRGQLRRLSQDDALRARYSALGREQASRFTWRAAAERLLDVVAEVHGQDRARAG